LDVARTEGGGVANGAAGGAAYGGDSGEACSQQHSLARKGGEGGEGGAGGVGGAGGAGGGGEDGGEGGGQSLLGEEVCVAGASGGQAAAARPTLHAVLGETSEVRATALLRIARCGAAFLVRLALA